VVVFVTVVLVVVVVAVDVVDEVDEDEQGSNMIHSTMVVDEDVVVVVTIGFAVTSSTTGVLTTCSKSVHCTCFIQSGSV
jgi:hypothetical protein